MNAEDALRGNNILIQVPLRNLLAFLRRHTLSHNGMPFPDSAAELILLGGQARRMFSRPNLAGMLDCSEQQVKSLEARGMPSTSLGVFRRYYMDEVQLWLSGDLDGCQRLVELRGGTWEKKRLDHGDKEEEPA